MAFDPKRDYPLGARRPDLVTTPRGIPLEEITLESAREGRLNADEIRATPKTLRLQAEVALAAGRPSLAESLERAAELAAVPDDELLEIYTALRPRRASPEQLEDWAQHLESLGAEKNAAFVREAAAAYAERGLLADA
jgi:propanediol dehydratase small subunit